MILYHGSTVCIEKPEIRQGEVYLDFGVGFYTTTSYEQAERWARIKMRRNNVNVGYVSVYGLNFEQGDLDIKRFNTADEDWLNFVVNNRKGEQLVDGIDLHIGTVAYSANFKIFNVC